jgi:Fe-S oxidoreductase
MQVKGIVERTQAYLCLDCGKCTASCPLAWVDANYSPRRIVERVVFGEAGEVAADPRLWTCMTCGLCSMRCPSQVDFTRFIVEMRAEAYRAGHRGTYAHDGLVQEVMRLQAAGVTQDRTGWLSEDLKTATEGEYLFFSGCLPFFDVIFDELGFQGTEIARSAIRLLNQLGIEPAVSNEERCCGADLLLAGDVEGARRLAEANVAAIQATGAQKVVFACAECYNAFRTDYPQRVGPLPFQPMHITELLAGRLGDLAFEERCGRVTYHDPCRMGRFLGVYEPPRALLRAVPGVELVEMADNRAQAGCCGSTAWINCGGCAKEIQLDKIQQARETGAGVMLTTCPKCQIHLSCALKDQAAGERIEVGDVVSWVARALAG